MNACKIAVGMGAEVTILDINTNRLAYLDDIFQTQITTLVSNDRNIEKIARESDVVIGAVLIPGAKAPRLIRREHLKMMKKGAVLVDVAVDQGGCFETTKATYHDDPVYVVDDVIHYCVANMPGAVARTATLALTNATLTHGLSLADKGVKAACAESGGPAPGTQYLRRQVYLQGSRRGIRAGLYPGPRAAVNQLELTNWTRR